MRAAAFTVAGSSAVLGGASLAAWTRRFGASRASASFHQAWKSSIVYAPAAPPMAPATAPLTGSMRPDAAGIMLAGHGHPLPRRDADRQPRGRLAPCAQGVAGRAHGRLRGHPP